MKDMADKGMIISDPLDLMMIRGSNQAFIRFHNFKVPVEKTLGGVGEGFTDLVAALDANADKAAVPGLDWRNCAMDGKPLKMDGVSAGRADVFNSLNRDGPDLVLPTPPL